MGNNKRTILLAGLGVTKYEEAIYEYEQNNQIHTIKEKFASLAILKMLNNLSDENPKDYPFPNEFCIFTTPFENGRNGSEYKNYDNYIHEHCNNCDHNDGLKKRLTDFQEQNPSKNFNFYNENISSQDSEKKISENFNIFIEKLNEEDDVYIDISNSFRSVPIILLSAIERAKTTKHINIKGIFYATFNKINGKNETIINLLNFQKFNEWSYKLRQFSKTGYYVQEQSHSDFFSSLSDNSEHFNLFTCLKKIDENLESFSNNIYKPNKIAAVEHALKLKYWLSKYKEIESDLNEHNMNYYQEYSDLIKLISPFFDKFAFYKKEDDTRKSTLYTYNLAHITNLCAKFKLEQSAITFLLENLRAIVLEEKSKEKKHIINSIKKEKKIIKLKRIYYGHFYSVEEDYYKVNNYEHGILKSNEIKRSNYSRNKLIKPKIKLIDGFITQNTYENIKDLRNSTNHAAYNTIQENQIDIHSFTKNILDEYPCDSTKIPETLAVEKNNIWYDDLINKRLSPEQFKESLLKYLTSFDNMNIMEQIENFKYYGFTRELFCEDEINKKEIWNNFIEKFVKSSNNGKNEDKVKLNTFQTYAVKNELHKLFFK